MKRSIFLSAAFLLISSCSNISPEAKKPLEPNLEENDYGVVIINSVEPIKLKAGKIICPIGTFIRPVGESTKQVYCYSRDGKFDATNSTIKLANTAIICRNQINITSQRTGICEAN